MLSAPKHRIISAMRLSPIMHGEPDGRVVRVGPFDAMTRVGRKVNVIARCEPDRFRMPLEPEDRRAPEQENPFGTILIVPEPRRARMRVGNDALDPQRRRPQQLRDLLLGAA